MTAEEINGDLISGPGEVMIETFEEHGQEYQHELIPAVLVHSHGPFAWGEKRRRCRA